MLSNGISIRDLATTCGTRIHHLLQNRYVAAATLTFTASVSVVASCAFACEYIVPNTNSRYVKVERSHVTMTCIAATGVAIAVNLLLSKSLGLPLSLKSVAGISAGASGMILGMAYQLYA